MDNANRNHEERYLTGDLPQNRPSAKPIPEFNEISFYEVRF